VKGYVKGREDDQDTYQKGVQVGENEERERMRREGYKVHWGSLKETDKAKGNTQSEL